MAVAVLLIAALKPVSFAGAEDAVPRLPKDALRVPLVRQATNYSCGAAALLSVLFYWNAYDGGESSLYKDLETTPENGTEPGKIMEVAQANDLKAAMKVDQELSDLRAALDRGETVILDIQAWPDHMDPGESWKDRWDDGHYVVLVAMDGAFAYFMDPSVSGKYGYIPLSELPDRWHDYEDRHGTIERYQHLAVYISGDEPFEPATLERIR